MKISRVEARSIAMPLIEPYEIAYQKVETATTL